MNDNSACLIWGTPASVDLTDRPGVKLVDSPRAGGRYVIFRRARHMLENQDELFKVRLTSWLIEQRRLGFENPEITEHTIKEIEQRRDLSVHERADRLLQYIQQETQSIGDAVEVFDETVLAVSDSTNGHEVKFLVEYLLHRNWVQQYSTSSYILTVDGYARLAEIENVATDSSQAFVAMWFDDSMNDVYENGIEPGIKDAGYETRRIDRVEHINKIDDEIIAEIRRSRFVVADFTHGDTGARGGVYYEAGFAHGLNIPVIFTCREDILEDIHFDTRQYNHIPWEEGKLEVFSKALSDRISAAIGDGPNKTQNTG